MSEISKGKLKERLMSIENRTGVNVMVDIYELSDKQINEVLDEAKAGFLKQVHFSDLKHIREYIAYHRELKDFNDGFLEALEWFLEWFGGKTE